MSENTNNISRRSAVKLGVVTGLVGLGAKELINGKDGIETPTGVFIPLYENHFQGLTAIPNNLDGFFKEYPMYKEIHSQNAQQILTSKSDVNKPPFVVSIDSFSPSVLSQIAKQGTKIILGDTDVPFTNITDLSPVAQVLLGGIGVGLLANTPSEKKYGRRNVMRKVAAGAIVWGSDTISTLITGVATFTLDQENALRRIIIRTNGIMTHGHPEHAIVFFRNLVSADKMLLASNLVKAGDGKKPRIAFNFGAGHSGIEDFLQAGPEIIRTLITTFPKEYLQATIDLNGSLDDLCSIRIITLPKDFKPGAMEQNKGIIDEKKYDLDLKSKIVEKLNF